MPEDERPPQDWWDACMASVSGADKAAVCGHIFHNVLGGSRARADPSMFKEYYRYEKVVKRGDQWCVIHTHGADAGKTIACHDSQAKAQAQHAAIQISKAKRSKESYRHPDFQKIYKQFLNYEDGENRYYTWIKALNLDETRPYAQSMKEQFKWVRKHADFKLWKEDQKAKYWTVEAGFPLESMNANVYTKDELLRAARTIKGQPVSLNHKFSLPTVDVLGGEYENDVVEAIIRVPNNLHCPICDKGKTINDLIESNGIVNVSLEAACDYGYGATCEGMHFTGLSLLTKDVLPGIPLTRIMPLESIMVEALQASTPKRKRKVKKVKMKIVTEQAHDCPEGQVWDETSQSCRDKEPETTDATVGKPAQGMPGEQVDIVQPAQGPGIRKTAPRTVKPDEHGQCPEGYIFDGEQELCVLDTSCPEGQHWDDDAQQCVADTEAQPEQPETEMGTSPGEMKEDVLTDAPTEQPKPEDKPTGGPTPLVQVPPSGEPAPEAPPSLPAPEVASEIEPKPPTACPDGYHMDPETLNCVPDEPIGEKVKRFKAEDKARTLRQQLAVWEQRYVEVDKKYNQVLGQNIEQRNTIGKLEKRIAKLQNDLMDEERRAKEWQRRLGDTTVSRDDYKKKLMELQSQNETLTTKYHDTLATNLELSRKLTKSNEDYLNLANEKDQIEEKLKTAKRFAKRTIKLKV